MFWQHFTKISVKRNMINHRIAIFGLGWLGKPLAFHLKTLGFDVYAASRNKEKIAEIAASGITGFEVEYDSNLTKTKICLNPTTINSIDFIVICLPPSKFKRYDEFVVSIAQQFSNKTKVIFTSSTGVYEDINTEIDEESRKIDNHPVNEAEKKLRNLLANRLTVLRLAGLIGGNRHPVKYFIQRNMIPNSSAPVNLVCLKDVIRAIEWILNKQIYGYDFNIVNPYHPTKKDYYLCAAKTLYGKIISSDVGKGGKLVNGKKFQELTGFNYLFDLDDWSLFSGYAE